MESFNVYAPNFPYRVVRRAEELGLVFAGGYATTDSVEIARELREMGATVFDSHHRVWKDEPEIVGWRVEIPAKREGAIEHTASSEVLSATDGWNADSANDFAVENGGRVVARVVR